MGNSEEEEQKMKDVGRLMELAKLLLDYGLDVEQTKKACDMALPSCGVPSTADETLTYIGRVANILHLSMGAPESPSLSDLSEYLGLIFMYGDLF